MRRIRRYRGGHAAPKGPTGAVRRALRLAGALGLLVGVVAAGMYVARDRAAPGAADAVTAGQASPATSNDASRPPVTPVPVGSDPGDAAPDFTVRTAGGGTFSLSSHRGRVVVLDFLAPGCLDCTAELSTLTKAWQAFRDDGVVVLVVDVGSLTPEEAADYYRGLGGGDYFYGEDRKFRVAQAYEVIELASTFVIGPAGIVTFRDSGFTSPGTLETEIRRVLT